MRPIASKQDPLRYPLNEIFGTQAQVRVLRVMAVEVDGPLTASDIAKRTGLTVPGAQKSLGKLLRSGFITQVGGGRKHQYEIRRSDRLMQIAIELFQSECANYLRTGLEGVEKDFDLTIELEGYTKADIPDLELDGITILCGVVPNKPTGSTRQRATKTMTHRQKDDQLKLMCRRLADIIQQDASSPS